MTSIEIKKLITSGDSGKWEVVLSKAATSEITFLANKICNGDKFYLEDLTQEGKSILFSKLDKYDESFSLTTFIANVIYHDLVKYFYKLKGNEGYETDVKNLSIISDDCNNSNNMTSKAVANAMAFKQFSNKVTSVKNNEGKLVDAVSLASDDSFTYHEKLGYMNAMNKLERLYSNYSSKDREIFKANALNTKQKDIAKANNCSCETIRLKVKKFEEIRNNFSNEEIDLLFHGVQCGMSLSIL